MADEVQTAAEIKTEYSRSPGYDSLIEAGCTEKVAAALDEMFVEELVQFSELDERAIEALKELDEDGAIAVLKQFRDSNLQHVQNKSAFLCGVMKIYRQRLKAERGGKVTTSQKIGPSEDEIQALLERTKYSLDVTTGQRRYGGPPPKDVYEGEEPGPGCQVFVGRIPRDVFEDELVPLLEKAGTIWDFRLMMDPLTGQNRGYGFATFVNKEMAAESVKQLDNYEIKTKKFLGVCLSQSNCRLFIGSIPKSKTKDEIFNEFEGLSPGLRDVILYHQTEDKTKNRGFCFLEYTDHKSASQARRKLGSGKTKVWNNIVSVDWADPIDNPSDEVMSKVKVLYVKNLSAKATEEVVQTTFSAYGEVERVKKIKDYAFVHFKERDHAMKAMSELNGLNLEGEPIEISLAKPVDKKKKERQLERKMNQHMGMGGPFGGPMPRGRGRGGRGGMGMPPMHFPPMPYNNGGFVDDYYDYMGFGGGFGAGGYDDPYFGHMGMGGGPGFRGGRGGMMRGFRGGMGGAPMGFGRGRGNGRGRGGRGRGAMSGPRGKTNLPGKHSACKKKIKSKTKIASTNCAKSANMCQIGELVQKTHLREAKVLAERCSLYYCPTVWLQHVLRTKTKQNFHRTPLLQFVLLEIRSCKPPKRLQNLISTEQKLWWLPEYVIELTLLLHCRGRALAPHERTMVTKQDLFSAAISTT